MHVLAWLASHNAMYLGWVLVRAWRRISLSEVRIANKYGNTSERTPHRENPVSVRMEASYSRAFNLLKIWELKTRCHLA